MIFADYVLVLHRLCDLFFGSSGSSVSYKSSISATESINGVAISILNIQLDGLGDRTSFPPFPTSSVVAPALASIRSTLCRPSLVAASSGDSNVCTISSDTAAADNCLSAVLRRRSRLSASQELRRVVLAVGMAPSVAATTAQAVALTVYAMRCPKAAIRVRGAGQVVALQAPATSPITDPGASSLGKTYLPITSYHTETDQATGAGVTAVLLINLQCAEAGCARPAVAPTPKVRLLTPPANSAALHAGLTSGSLAEAGLWVQVPEPTPGTAADAAQLLEGEAGSELMGGWQLQELTVVLFPTETGGQCADNGTLMASMAATAVKTAAAAAAELADTPLTRVSSLRRIGISGVLPKRLASLMMAVLSGSARPEVQEELVERLDLKNSMGPIDGMLIFDVDENGSIVADDGVRVKVTPVPAAALRAKPEDATLKEKIEELESKTQKMVSDMKKIEALLKKQNV